MTGIPSVFRSGKYQKGGDEMTYIIRIRRQAAPNSEPFWQEFSCDGNPDATIASVLNELNCRDPLTDIADRSADPVSWEYGCMVRKCGACAMRINGIPRLACSTSVGSLKGKRVILEPLSKFPLVRDLIVDRTAVFESLKKIRLWLSDKAYMTEYTHNPRYQSARCLMCGCCLEVCPGFSASGARSFGGAVIPVNAYRILNEEHNAVHHREIAQEYRKFYFEGCGNSLSCHDICPAGIPVEELMVRSNAAAVWNR